MTQKEAEAKLEYLETTEEEKAHGLRRIKRRHLTKPGEMTSQDCWVKTKLSLNPDVLEFYESNSEKINAVLREAMEKKKLSEVLLADPEFVSQLREKLAA